MFMFRMLSLFAGGLALLVPPMLFNETTLSHWESWQAVITLTGITLVSLSFIFVGLIGHRLRKSPKLRMAAGLLLTVPLAGSAAMLLSSQANPPEVLWTCGVILSFTVVQYIVFVFPINNERKQRPMRDRELEQGTPSTWRLR
ncbi:hypothetical protein [Massilia horti]|uniref:Transmembrane protein n=1 Tax=Massilia horti TaxID=2562153 RepID=A0A4Y9T4K2_9BURK|nr:hypothetical protein [Massilia horti]TFW35581.1 hypothetical protein E4O92_01965 [Massilia horti]